jgi:hypothetical protein
VVLLPQARRAGHRLSCSFAAVGPRVPGDRRCEAAIRPFLHATDVYVCEPRILAAHFHPTPRTGDCFFFATFKRQPQTAGKSIRAVRAAVCLLGTRLY